ncbi:MAG: aquaporin Z, partial [Candidatus Eremiobacteraeota bacterium]|nr:aquaporin Z [Candidatus Eremiobacteraeota bacterium]
MARRLSAEFLGTFWLVFGGCGSAIFAALFLTHDKLQTPIGIGFAGVAFAFGLTVLTGAYAFGPISGAHFNPAVTVGLWLGKRFEGRDVLWYIIVQCIGAIAAAAVLYAILSGRADFAGAGNFAANGFGDHSPGGYGMASAFVAEAVLTFFFLMVILGSTDRRAPAGFAPLAIGLCLTLIHLICIPITNTSVNPARSLGPALFAEGGWAIG